MSMMLKSFIFTIFLIVSHDKLSLAKTLQSGRNVKSRDVWLPRQLGTFHLKDAGFVEVYPVTPSEKSNTNATSYAEQYNLYITTFNAGIFFISKRKLTKDYVINGICKLFKIY